MAQPGTAQISLKESVSLESLPRKYHRACFRKDIPVQIRALALLSLMAKKILITAPAYFDEAAVAIFQQIGEVKAKELQKEELLQQIAEYDVLAIRVDTNVDKELIDAAKKLKVIATGTTGINHIDVEYAKTKGIEVISLQGANTNSTAEHALALLLSLARKIAAAQSSLLSGEWNRAAFIGTELYGKKLGIVGFGRIGKDIAKIAQSFGMQILAYDPYLPENVFAECKATRITSMQKIFSEADIITLHVLLTEETKGLVNKQIFSLMKPSSLLINCSRGEIVSELDLLDALKSKKIAGAALDVFVTEPLPADSPLIKYARQQPNLVLTPHIGGSTKEAVHQAGIDVAAKTQEFFMKQNNKK